MDPVTEFETKIAQFFGAPYAVGIDCATHGLEICLIHTKANWIDCPKRTYLSVPFLATKLGIELRWFDIAWQDYYFLTNRVVDASVLWREKSYIPGTFMVISFQFQKHLSIGRAAMILCDNKEDAEALKRLSYDGRLPNIPWREQNIQHYGLHYYLQPELAQKGLDKLDAAIATPPRQWVYEDWNDLTTMDIFKSTI
jgi:dTDP-4-amino-4,6-dideoxygalactose transaminase